LYNKLPYIYYPDASAYKAVVLRYNPISRQEWGYNYEKYFEVELTPHTMLNGAVFFNNWEEPTRYVNANLMWNSSVNTGTVSLPNKIYTSEVNNPFFFPLLGINTVGTGTILGICSAVKALSQGQFGQFPLYAFTDEGVWALELADNGTFKARQPITRDVCINSKSITQIDSAVLFATDRGIMLISGSNSQCISDTLNSDAPFTPLTALPSLSSVISGFATEGNVTIVPFTQFLQNCRMLYDYTHQRIIVYNPAKTYAYVYSLKSKQWGMMPSAIQQDINAYPNALALVTASVSTNAVADFSKENNTPPSGSTAVSVNGLVITRPLKLDMPDVLKTVDTIIQRGYFQKGHVKSILYGSRNLFNWHLIYSSTDHYLRGFRGTPYKYYRIALLCTLEEKESVYGCTIQFTPRLTDQPR
jgi:hypothetical protein